MYVLSMFDCTIMHVLCRYMGLLLLKGLKRAENSSKDASSDSTALWTCMAIPRTSL